MMVPCDNCEYGMVDACPYRYDISQCPMVREMDEPYEWDGEEGCIGSGTNGSMVVDELMDKILESCKYCEDENGCKYKERMRCAVRCH